MELAEVGMQVGLRPIGRVGAVLGLREHVAERNCLQTWKTYPASWIVVVAVYVWSTRVTWSKEANGRGFVVDYILSAVCSICSAVIPDEHH